MAWQDEYDQVEDRLKKFWKDNPNGRVYTEPLKIAEDHLGIIIRAYIYKDIEDINPVATGIAEDHHGPKGANVTSWIENAETSAVGRALANWKYAAKKRPSVTEMEKVERGNTVSNNKAPDTKKDKDIFVPPPTVQKKIEGAVKEKDVKGTAEDKLSAVGLEVEEKRVVTHGTVKPECMACGSDLWDNRQDKYDKKINETYPDWKCKSKECGRIWYMESYANDKKAPEVWYMPELPKGKDINDLEENELPF